MKTHFTPIVGLDFVDAAGIRIFSFQLCAPRNGRLEAVALVTIENDTVTRNEAIDSLAKRKPAIERLAFKYQQRSIPQRFQS